MIDGSAPNLVRQKVSLRIATVGEVSGIPFVVETASKATRIPIAPKYLPVLWCSPDLKVASRDLYASARAPPSLNGRELDRRNVADP